MSKIEAIHISNFKFFGESRPIQLGGKNLLLYGENGSGKSSLYNAIYTLLEASAKDVEGVQKYFMPLNESPYSLLNIYADVTHGYENSNSFIEIVDDTNRHYRLSYDDTRACGNAELRESYRVAEFINYQALFNFQLFRNSEEANLRRVFDYSVIPYLPCSIFEYNGAQLSMLADLFAAYGDDKCMQQSNRRGKPVIYKHNTPYRQFLQLERKINDEMTSLIEYINVQLPIIIAKLGYDFSAVLTYNPLSHRKFDRWIKRFPYSIILEINKYNGIELSIKHPNTFLNEAKMAALAFAIRWAILTRRPSIEVAPDALRVLVLDDLMISLDMGNRERVIRFLLNDEWAQQYQILFLTHERMLFETLYKELTARKRTAQKQSIDEWIVLEMYDKQVGNKHFPVLQEYQSAYGRALTYFRGTDRPIDYMASGNALRQAIEGEFKRIFGMLHVSQFENKAVDYSKLMLGDCIKIAKACFPLRKLPTDCITRLQTLTWFALNPLSHDNPYMDFYRAELAEAFKVYEALDAMRQVLLLPTNSHLHLTVADGNASADYDIQINKELYAIIDAVGQTGSIADCGMACTVKDAAGRFICHIDDPTLSDAYNRILAYHQAIYGEMPIDKSSQLFDDLYDDQHHTLMQLLHEAIQRERQYLHIDE